MSVRSCSHHVALASLSVLAAASPGLAAGRVRIEVRETGVYRLTGEDLVKAGAPLAKMRVGKLGLSCQGEPVACRIVGDDKGKLSETSAIIFYGEGLDTRFTDTNVYWLAWAGEPGPRMGRLALLEGGAAAITTFRETARVEENREYGYLVRAPEKGLLDPWFWARLTPQEPKTIEFDLPGFVAGEADVVVTVNVRGRTFRPFKPDHHVAAEVNGQALGDVRFDDQEPAAVEATVPAEVMKPQGNRLTVSCPGDTELGADEQVYFDSVSVEYERELTATNGRIAFGLAAGTSGQVTIQGLSGETAEIYRVTSAGAAAFASAPCAGGKATIGLTAEDDERYTVTTEAAYLSPVGVATAAEAGLRSVDNRADLVIIAHDDFCDAVAPLAKHRRKQGLKVRVVPVSRIYDEFSGGLFTPVAIRDFLAFAYENWQRPAPRYVLLVGDANYDYRDYLGTGEPNYVPVYPVRVRNSIETPTDAFYVCLEGRDHIPEMYIGRLPARSADHAARLCERIVAYETSPPEGEWRKRVVIIADHELNSKGATWFERSSEKDAELCEYYGVAAERIYLRAAGLSRDNPADENRKLVREKATPVALAALEQGCVLFIFQGHGAADYLSRERVLLSSDVGGIDNGGRSALGVLVTCFAGAFDDPQADGGQCIAEKLLNAPSGLIACIGPTRLGGHNIEAHVLNRLLNAPKTPVGEVFAAAKQDLLGRMQKYWRLVENYNLLGDPLLVLPIEPVAPEVAGPGPEGPPQEDPFADENGNRIADILEKRAADGGYRRYGREGKGLLAAFCALARPPTRGDISAIERLGGHVIEVMGPPWGMEIVLPIINVAPLVEASPVITMLQESNQYGTWIRSGRVDGVEDGREQGPIVEEE